MEENKCKRRTRKSVKSDLDYALSSQSSDEEVYKKKISTPKKPKNHTNEENEISGLNLTSSSSPNKSSNNNYIK